MRDLIEPAELEVGRVDLLDPPVMEAGRGRVLPTDDKEWACIEIVTFYNFIEKCFVYPGKAYTLYLIYNFLI